MIKRPNRRLRWISECKIDMEIAKEIMRKIKKERLRMEESFRY